MMRTEDPMPMCVEAVSFDGGRACRWFSDTDVGCKEEADEEEMILRRGCADCGRAEPEAETDACLAGAEGASGSGLLLRRGATGGFVEGDGGAGACLADDPDGRGGRGGSDPATDDAAGVAFLDGSAKGGG